MKQNDILYETAKKNKLIEYLNEMITENGSNCVHVSVVSLAGDCVSGSVAVTEKC